MEKFDIIRGALNKLSVPFDESNFYSDTIYKLADKEYDDIIANALVGTSLSLTSTIATLDLSVDETLEYNGELYYAYMLPQDFIFLNEKTSEELIFSRNRIYRKDNGIFKINYTKTNDVNKLNPIFKKYLEYYLASELAPSINRRSVQDELFNKALFYLEKIKETEFQNNKDVFGTLGVSFY